MILIGYSIKNNDYSSNTFSYFILIQKILAVVHYNT